MVTQKYQNTWKDYVSNAVIGLVILTIVYCAFSLVVPIKQSLHNEGVRQQATANKYIDQQKVYDGGQVIEWTLAGHTTDGKKIWRARLISELSIVYRNNKYDRWLYKTEQPDQVTITRVEPHANGKWIEDVPQVNTNK